MANRKHQQVVKKKMKKIEKLVKNNILYVRSNSDFNFYFVIYFIDDT